MRYFHSDIWIRFYVWRNTEVNVCRRTVSDWLPLNTHRVRDGNEVCTVYVAFHLQCLFCMRNLCVCFALEYIYSWISSANSPAWCSSNGTEPRLMSQVGTAREVVRVRRAACIPSRSSWSAICLLQSRDWSSRTARFVRLVLKVLMQNDGDFVDIILLYVVSRSVAVKGTD